VSTLGPASHGPVQVGPNTGNALNPALVPLVESLIDAADASVIIRDAKALHDQTVGLTLSSGCFRGSCKPINERLHATAIPPTFVVGGIVDVEWQWRATSH
jgi:hypothetical protein